MASVTERRVDVPLAVLEDSPERRHPRPCQPVHNGALRSKGHVSVGAARLAQQRPLHVSVLPLKRPLRSRNAPRVYPANRRTCNQRPRPRTRSPSARSGSLARVRRSRPNADEAFVVHEVPELMIINAVAGGKRSPGNDGAGHAARRSLSSKAVADQAQIAALGADPVRGMRGYLREGRPAPLWVRSGSATRARPSAPTF